MPYFRASAYLHRFAVLGTGLTLAVALAAGVATVALLTQSGQDDISQYTLRFPIEVSRPDASAIATVVEALDRLCSSCEAKASEGDFTLTGPRNELDQREILSTLVEHGFLVSSYEVEFGPSLDLLIQQARSGKALAYYLLPLPLVLLVLAIVMRSRVPEIYGQQEQPRSWPIWKLISLGIGGGFVFAGISAVLAAVVGWLGFPVAEQPWLRALVRQGTATDYLLVISVVILAPLGEEFFFRGWVFPYFGELNLAAGYLVSSALFATIHLHPPALVIYFALGLGLAWLYSFTGSLLTPICAHAVNNWLALALLA